MISRARVPVFLFVSVLAAPSNHSTDARRALAFRISAEQMANMHAKHKPPPAAKEAPAEDLHAKIAAVSATLGLSDDGRPAVSACPAASKIAAANAALGLTNHSADRTRATLERFDWAAWDWPAARCGCGVLLNAASDPHYRTTETYFVYAALALSSRLRTANRGTSVACTGGVRIALYAPKDAVEDLYRHGRAKFLRDLSVVDVVRPYPPIKKYATHAGGAKDSSVWQQRFRAKAESPFAYTLLLDTDAFPCAGFERLFDLLRHVDTGSIKDSTPTQGYTDKPAAKSFEQLPVRNLGTVLYRTEDNNVRAMIEEEGRVFDRMLRNGDKVWGDQDAFREALWRFAFERGVVRDRQIDESVVCRRFSKREGSWHGLPCARSSCLIRHHKDQEALVAPLERKLSCWAHCLGSRARASDRWFDTSACGKDGTLMRLAVCDWHTAADIGRLEAKSQREQGSHVKWAEFKPQA